MKLRFGMIGAGAIAQTYAQAFSRCQAAALLAVCDVRREAADAIGQAVHCSSYGDIGELMNRGDLDAVIVCTPPATHPDICERMLEGGLHVLCEKPLAIDSLSARRMFNAATRAGRVLTMASKFRYVEDVVAAKSIVASGLLGEIVSFENMFTAHVDMAARWNSDPRMSGGGVLIDNGTHSVDIMRYLFGPLSELQVVEGKRIQTARVEDTVRLFVRTNGGVMGSIDLSWTISKEQPHYLSIYGSQGTLHVGWKESKYRRTSDADWTIFGKGYDKFAAFASQLDNFARHLRGEEPLVITAEDGLASVAAIEAAYRALHGTKWQPVAHLPHATHSNDYGTAVAT